MTGAPYAIPVPDLQWANAVHVTWPYDDELTADMTEEQRQSYEQARQEAETEAAKDRTVSGLANLAERAAWHRGRLTTAGGPAGTQVTWTVPRPPA